MIWTSVKASPCERKRKVMTDRGFAIREECQLRSEGDNAACCRSFILIMAASRWVMMV